MNTTIKHLGKFGLCGLMSLALLSQACTAGSDDAKPKKPPQQQSAAAGQPQALPAPQTSGGKPLMDALRERRTVRDYDSKPLAPQTLSNLLWAAFGVNRPGNKGRTAPSAHDAQEISIYVVTKEGVWLYDAFANSLQPVSNQDIRALTGKQGFVKDAPVNLVFVSDMSKFRNDDDEYRRFYAAADTGYISQNVYLFCASEGLATMVRAYIDKPALAKALNLASNQHIILAQSVGYPEK
ncbi:MAG: McbC-like oxidoreductase for polypeptide thioester cyclization [Burkholderiaceae bacterium]|nr:McbC-like oxidoreductase for polypeptide thioester cyclization [Burkholderiaceae bacterium]